VGYITFHCICFAIIVYYWSEIYSPIFTVSSTMPSVSSIMPSVLQILHWSIIGLRCFILLIHICMVALIALIPVDIAGSQVKPLGFSCSPCSPTGGGDSISLVNVVISIFVIRAAPWHPKIMVVIRTIVVYRNIESVLPISRSSSATLEVQLSRWFALSTSAASMLMTLAGVGSSACWIWLLTVAGVSLYTLCW